MKHHPNIQETVLQKLKAFKARLETIMDMKVVLLPLEYMRYMDEVERRKKTSHFFVRADNIGAH